jgi:hypothetical protein
MVYVLPCSGMILALYYHENHLHLLTPETEVSNAVPTPHCPLGGPERQSQNLSFIRDATVLKFPYTFPGGLPRISDTTDSLAMWIA